MNLGGVRLQVYSSVPPILFVILSEAKDLHFVSSLKGLTALDKPPIGTIEVEL